MKHELKIITGPTVHDTRVLIDDEPIGLIQKVVFKASVGHTAPIIQITFPDFRPHEKTNGVFAKQLEATLEKLKEFPHVQVILEPIW